MSSKIREALVEVESILSTWIDHLPPVIQEKAQEAIDKAESALAEPPRYCDVMSLESARKLWFAKEIVPRLDGDLPLGKEIPFEEWFVSQIEQEAKGEAK